jgi:hypothetical protein
MKLIGCRARALPALFLGSPAIFPCRLAPCTSQKRARCLLRCGALARACRAPIHMSTTASNPAKSVGGDGCSMVRRDGDKRKPCHVCWKLHQKNRKSSWSCGSCRRSVCGPETGRGCFDIHVRDVQGISASEIIPETGAEAPQATRRAREMM